MIKRKLTLLSIFLISAVALAAGFKDYSWDEMRFGGSASGERKIVFDQVPDGSSAEISVDPANEEFVFNNKGNFDSGLDIAGKLDVSSTSIGSRPCPPMTEAQRDAIGTPSDGDCIYNTDTKALNTYDGNLTSWVAVGTGAGGSGALSYISGDNSDFELSVGDYVSYDDAAGDEPVDAVGAGATITCTRVEDDAMLGSAHFRITKDGSDRQGEGCSLDYQIDDTYVNSPEVFYLRFRGKSSANYAEGDIKVYLLHSTDDVTYTLLPNPLSSVDSNILNKALKGESTTYYKWQTVQGSKYYRFAFHIATTNASAYTYDVDSVLNGPLAIAYGPANVDWKDVDSPTIANGVTIGNGTFVEQWAQKGKDLFVRGKVVFGSTTSVTGDIRFTIPNSLTADTDFIGFGENIGDGNSLENGVQDVRNTVQLHNDANTIRLRYNRVVDSSAASPIRQGVSTATDPFTWGTSDEITYSYKIPIEGWGGDVQYSQAFSNRDIRVEADGSSTSVTSSIPSVVFTTETKDTTSSFNGTTWTSPVNRTCSITFGAETANTTDTTIYIGRLYVNGSNTGKRFWDHRQNMYSGTSARKTGFGTLIHDFSVGDEVTVRIESTTTLSLNDAQLSIWCPSSSGTLMERPEVHARYTSDAAPSITSGVETLITYEDKEEDYFNAYSSGLYTIPIAGVYFVACRQQYDNASFSVGTTTEISIKVGSTLIEKDSVEIDAANTTRPTNRASTTKFFNVGDQISCVAYHNEGSNRSLRASAERNTFSITLIK